MIAEIITTAKADQIVSNPTIVEAEDLFLIPPLTFWDDGADPFKIYNHKEKYDSIFTAIDNTTQNAWVEDFSVGAEAFLWLDSQYSAKNCQFHEIPSENYDNIKSLKNIHLIFPDTEDFFMGYSIFSNCIKTIFYDFEEKTFVKQKFISLEKAFSWLLGQVEPPSRNIPIFCRNKERGFMFSCNEFSNPLITATIK